MVHIQTHTLAQHGRRNENANEVTMPMKCQAPPPGREAGNAKEETTHLTQNGQTLKGQGQKKIWKTGWTTNQTPTRVGAHRSIWHNLHCENQTHLGTRKTETWFNTRYTQEHAKIGGQGDFSPQMMYPVAYGEYGAHVQWPKSQFNPIDIWRSQPLNWHMRMQEQQTICIDIYFQFLLRPGPFFASTLFSATFFPISNPQGPCMTRHDVNSNWHGYCPHPHASDSYSNKANPAQILDPGTCFILREWPYTGHFVFAA